MEISPDQLFYFKLLLVVAVCIISATLFYLTWGWIVNEPSAIYTYTDGEGNVTVYRILDAGCKPAGELKKLLQVDNLPLTVVLYREVDSKGRSMGPIYARTPADFGRRMK